MKSFKKTFFLIKQTIINFLFVEIWDYLILRKAKDSIKNYQEYIEYYHSNSETKTQIDFIDDYKIICEQKDLWPLWEICVRHDYQKYVECKIKKWDIVWDVWAHIWTFSIYAANKWAIVYAFEPNKRNFEILKNNIKLNNFESKITPLNYWIASLNWNVSFWNNCINTWWWWFNYNSDILLNDIETIEVKNISQIFKELNIEKIDLLKIDIEWAEYDIFEKMTNNESSRIEVIVGEYHLFPDKLDWNMNFLRKLFEKLWYKKIVSYFPFLFFASKK